MTKIAEKIKSEFADNWFQVYEAKSKSIREHYGDVDDSVTFFFEDNSFLTYSGLEIWKSALECRLPSVLSAEYSNMIKREKENEIRLAKISDLFLNKGIFFEDEDENLKTFEVDQTKCFCCERSAKDGWGMYRQNSIGENGIWACKYHNQRI